MEIFEESLKSKVQVQCCHLYIFFEGKFGVFFFEFKKNYLEMIPWKELLTDYRLVLRWPLCCYSTCHESTGHLELEHRVWNEKIDLFLKTRLTCELKVIFVLYEEIITVVFPVELSMDDSLTVDDVKVKLVFASSDI